MSDRLRQPSAVTLSAQNLAFAPQGFIGNSPPIHFPHVVGQQQERAAMNADLEKQAQKMKDHEQQRLRLQQLNAKGSAAANPDAMIAQMLGKPLAPNLFAGSNVRPAQPNFLHGHGVQYGSPLSTPLYPAFIPRPMEASGNQQTAAPNRSFVHSFTPHQFGPSHLPSAIHLTPKDLENAMMQQFGGTKMDSGNLSNAAPDRNFTDLQNSKPANMGDSVFVIPTMPAMVGPDGQYYPGAIGAQAFAMPSWTKDKTKIPEEYSKFLNACLLPNRPYGADFPDTSLVYVLLRTSGLPNEVLGTIWALTNRSQPGQLIKEEFFAALALVALAQETGALASLEMLSAIARPPVPRLSLSALNVPSISTPSYQAPSVVPIPALTTQAANPNVARRQSSDLIDAAPTWAASRSQSLNPATAAAPPSDDFADFSNFNANPAPTSGSSAVLHPTGDTMAKDLDRYDALRALAEPLETNVEKAKSDEKKDVILHVPSSTSGKTYGDDFADFSNAAVTNIPANYSTDRRLSGTVGEKMATASSTIDGMAISRSQTEPKLTPFGKDAPKKDLNELLRQTFESLDLGGGSNSPAVGSGKSDDDASSLKSGSKEPSVHSLDLHSVKHFDVEQQQSGDFSIGRSPTGSISLVDRYAAFRENGISNGDSSTVEKHVDAWTRCLEACLQLLKQADKLFAKAETEDLRREILATERGSKYLCGNVQIYRVTKRIRLSLQTMAFQTDKLIDLLTDIDEAWNSLCGLVAFSHLLPKLENLDFRNALVQGGPANEQQKASCCGVCLLNVDATCKTDQGATFDYKLIYGGRQYHAQCANLWINCIDSVLPALDVPCLL